jgi:hypothetical protein
LQAYLAPLKIFAFEKSAKCACEMRARQYGKYLNQFYENIPNDHTFVLQQTASMKKKKIITNCPSCMNENKHTVLFDTTRPDRDYPEAVTLVFSVNECDGCGNVSMLYREIDNESREVDEQATYPDDHLYNLGENHQVFLKLAEIKTLPKVVQGIYKEVQNAINSESLVLAGIGLRALVEAICIQQKIPGGNLQKKIEALKSNGYISIKDYPIIDKLRLIGNQSAHKIKSMPLEVLIHALRIVNHMINTIYLLPKISRKIRI